MLKRIMANILVVVLLVSLCLVTVSADNTQTSTIITQWDGTIPSNGTTVVEGKAFAATTDLLSANRTMSVRTAGYGPGVTSATENGDSYLIVNHSSLVCNYRSLISTLVKDTTAVASVKYDIRIPEDDYSEKPRNIRFNFTTAQGSTIVNPTTVKVTASNGEFSVSVSETSDSTAITGTSTTAPYTVGKWTTVEIRGYRTERNTLKIGVYVDENQIFYGEGTSAVYTGDLAINQMFFEQSTYKDSTGATTTFSTDYDDITIAAIGTENAPTDFSLVNDIIGIDFSDVPETEATTLKAANKGMFSEAVVLQESSNSTAPFKGTTKYKAVAKSAEDSNPVLDVVTTADGTSEQRLYLIQVTRGSLASYVNTKEETVLKYSYDIFIPSGTETSLRKQEVLFAGQDILGTTTTKYANGGLYVGSQIKDGKLSFYTSTYYENSDAVYGKNRSEEVAIELDAWNTIEYVLKITQDAENSLYNVKVYGMYKGNCCFTNEYVVYGDAFGICSNRYYIYGTGNEHSSIETKYDNISLKHISNWQEDTYNYNAWTKDYIYPLSLTYDVETGVTANVKIDNSKGTYTNKLCLVVALYNTNGKLEKMYTSNMLEDGYIEFTTNDSDFVKSGYTAKAFLFDDITTAIPYISSVKITLP